MLKWVRPRLGCVEPPSVFNRRHGYNHQQIRCPRPPHRQNHICRYYDRKWRSIEERVGGNVKAQYVWSPLDRWTPIRRKRSVGGTLDETKFVLKDYLDPTAIISSAGTVDERFSYGAFGPVRFLDASFVPLSGNTSAFAWTFLFHAEFLDTDSGLYNYGFRFYNPSLGRWLSRDPIGEEGGLNLYGFTGNDAVNKWDILGMACPPCPDCDGIYAACKKAAIDNYNKNIADAKADHTKTANEISAEEAAFVAKHCGKGGATVGLACRQGAAAIASAKHTVNNIELATKSLLKNPFASNFPLDDVPAKSPRMLLRI